MRENKITQITNKIIKKTNSHKCFCFFIKFISNTIFAMILWPLLDVFFANVIEKREFVYSINKHIIEPVMYGFFLTIFLTASKAVATKKLNGK